MPPAAVKGYACGMLYLASQSPRRRELLTQLGMTFGLLDVDVPEQREPGEPPAAYVSRVAREKAGAGLLQVVASKGAVVLGADTEVVLDDVVYGKPADAADAARMLRRLSGRVHECLSTVWVLSAGREQHAACVTQVHFEKLTDARIDAYVATGECFGKAGAYAIQGRAGLWVSHISGSYSGIMGLPAHETAQVLHAAGVRLV